MQILYAVTYISAFLVNLTEKNMYQTYEELTLTSTSLWSGKEGSQMNKKFPYNARNVKKD